MVVWYDSYTLMVKLFTDYFQYFEQVHERYSIIVVGIAAKSSRRVSKVNGLMGVKAFECFYRLVILGVNLIRMLQVLFCFQR